MATYYVATLARYVLVDADSDSEARQRGQAALRELYVVDQGRGGKNRPITITTVRLATDDEIELMRWHEKHGDPEAAQAKLGIASLLDEPLIDRPMQNKTDWTPMSVPGRE